MQTYREPIGRFVVEKLENFEGLPEHRQALIDNDIDPEDNWLLVWSFSDFDLAKDCALEHEVDDTLNRKWRARDRGADAPTFIERPLY